MGHARSDRKRGGCRGDLRSLKAFTLGFGCLVGGCASYGPHLTATPVPPGKDEFGINADAILVDRGFGPQLLPNPELSLRDGVSENIDWGLRFNVAGLEGNTRFRLARSEWLDFTLSPFLGAGFVPATNRDTGLLRLPIGGRMLLGWHVLPKADVVIGAGAIVDPQFPLTILRGEPTGSKAELSPTATVGSEIALGDALRLNPELNIVPTYDTAAKTWRTVTLQGGVSLRW